MYFKLHRYYLEGCLEIADNADTEDMLSLVPGGGSTQEPLHLSETVDNLGHPIPTEVEGTFPRPNAS